LAALVGFRMMRWWGWCMLSVEFGGGLRLLPVCQYVGNNETLLSHSSQMT